MLRTVADLLNQLLSEEKKRLDEYDLCHPPTIGKMYEGLTAEVLNRAIPTELGLQIVEGVIFDDSGQMTGQMDCMLVKGQGESIPYTSGYKWNIKDVIAVVEVKKTLYSNALADGFLHLREVRENYARCIQGGLVLNSIDSSAVRKTFAQLTKKVAPAFSQLDTLPFSEEMIFHTLVMEELSPILIILGYNGFKSEHAFRKGMMRFLKANTGQPGFGVGSFPQLIISENYSLIKANGQPYSIPMIDDYWDFYVSSAENPLIFVLELIWTRLQREYELCGLWGEDLGEEDMHRFLSGRAIRKDQTMGWEYEYRRVDRAVLEEKVVTEGWSPAFLKMPQFDVINRLCNGEVVDSEDPSMVRFVESEGFEMREFTDSLLKTGLVALNGSSLELLTDLCRCCILPTGQYIAGEDNTGRLSRWVEKYLKKRQEP